MVTECFWDKSDSGATFQMLSVTPARPWHQPSGPRFDRLHTGHLGHGEVAGAEGREAAPVGQPWAHAGPQAFIAGNTRLLQMRSRRQGVLGS